MAANEPDQNVRRPWLAFALSLLLPGLGHLYAGKLWRGIMAFAGVVVLSFATLALLLFKPVTGLLVALVLALFAPPIVALDAAMVSRAAARPFHLRPYNRWYAYLGAFVVTWALDAIRPDVIQAFCLPSDSMAPTLLAGDCILVDKRAATRRALTQHDLVVYRSPHDNATLIKRIAGVPGDTLLMRRDTLVRNGTPVTEPYLDWKRIMADRSGSSALGNWGPIVVPRERVYVLGDDRHASKDSRQVGFIPRVNFVGRPLAIYFSYDREADTPLPVLTAIRWRRIGTEPQ